MEIIVPAAGLSTRFPNMRPKYTLADYAGRMMFERAIQPFIGQYHITLGLLAENEQRYAIAEYVAKTYGDAVSVVILEHLTQGPADTVYQIIQQSGIHPQAEIFIKDCDSFFDHEIQSGNYVCVSSIRDHDVLKKIWAKSFVVANDQGIITSIIEKQVVSDKFCVGGYKFESAELYTSSYEKLLTAHVSEIFVSHVIETCLGAGGIFQVAPVTDYVDVGTAEDWWEYNDRAVVFCDIDGTIVRAQSRTESYADAIPLTENIRRVQQLATNGGLVVFTTARPVDRHQEIWQMLMNLGFENFQLITGLPNTKRILINDYNAANPYPRAIAVNVPRDSDTLSELI